MPYFSQANIVPARFGCQQRWLFSILLSLFSLSLSAANLGFTPDQVRFGATPLTGSQPVTLKVHNTRTSDLFLGQATLKNANQQQSQVFATQNDNCSNQTLAPGAECSLEVVFTPAAESGSYTGLLALPYNGGSQLTALLHNGESARDWAQKRMPPLVTSLSLSETPAVGQKVSMQWQVSGYNPRLLSRVSIMDCKGAESKCASGNGKEVLASDLLEPHSYALAPWGSEGGEAVTLGYRFDFDLDRSRFPHAPGDLWLRFSHLDTAGQRQGLKPLPLYLGGRLGEGYTTEGHTWRLPVAAPAFTALEPDLQLRADGVLDIPLMNLGQTAAGDEVILKKINGQSVEVGQQITLDSGAQVLLHADGFLRYTPPASAKSVLVGKTSSEQVAFTVQDSYGSEAQGNLNLKVEGLNHAPVAQKDEMQLVERLDGLIFHQYQGDHLASLDELTGTPTMSGWTPDLNVDRVFGKGLVFEGELQIDAAGEYTFHLSTEGVVYEKEVPEEGAEDKFDTIARTVTTGKADLVINGTSLLAADGSASIYLGAGRHPIRVRYLADHVSRALTLEYQGAHLGRQRVPNAALSTGQSVIDVLANDSDLDQNDSLTVSAVDGKPLSVDTPVTLASGARVTLRDDGRLAYDPSGAFAPLLGEATHSDTFSYTVVDSHGASAESEVDIILTTTDSIVSTLRDGLTLDYRPEPTRTLITLKNPTAESLSLDLVVSDTTDGSETERHRLVLPPGGSATQYLDTIAYPDDSYPKLIPDINRRVDVVYPGGYRIAGQAADGPTGIESSSTQWVLDEILKSNITLTALGSTYATSHFEVHNGNLIPIHIIYTIDGVRSEMTLAAGETRLMVLPYNAVVSLILYDKIFISLYSNVLKPLPAFKEQIVIAATCRTADFARFSVTNNSDEDIVLTAGTEAKSVSVGAGASTTFEVVYVPQITVKVKDAILGVFLPNDERCGMQFDFNVQSICTSPSFAFLSVTNNNTEYAYSIKLQSELISSLASPFTDINAGETKSFVIAPQGFNLGGTEGALYAHFGSEILKAETFTFTDASCE